jgi:hypothetical protein
VNDFLSPLQAVPVLLIAGSVGVASVVAALVCVRQHAVLSGIPAVAAILLSAILPFVGPTPATAREGAALQNFGARANFLERYDANRVLYGQPIGECGVRQTLMVCWTTYTRMESHPEYADPKYFIENGNLGAELLAARQLQRDRDPIVPPLLLGYFAAEAQRGNDPLYWIGHPITNPRVVGDRTEQYFDKIVLSWSTGSTDPASVTREPVGLQVWSMEHGQGDPANPPQWTQLRLGIVAVAAILLLSSFLAARLSRRRPALSGLDF